MSIFSDNLLSGNPAAVILLDEKTFENEPLLKKISARINISETSFVLCEENHFKIKWFSPLQKVDFCGHGTLASAFVLKQNDKYKDINHFCFTLIVLVPFHAVLRLFINDYDNDLLLLLLLG